MANNSAITFRRVINQHLMWIGLLVLFSGCTTTGRPYAPNQSEDREFPSEEERANFDDITVIPWTEPADLDLYARAGGKGLCASESAEAWARESRTGDISDLIGVPLMFVLGAAAGAATADSPEEVQARVDVIRESGVSPELSAMYQQRAHNGVMAFNEYSFATELRQGDAESMKVSFDRLRQDGIDTAVQVGVARVRTKREGSKRCDPELSLTVVTSVRLIDVHTEEEIYRASISRTTKAKKLKEWAKNDARHWRNELDERISEVTTALLEDAFVNISSPDSTGPTMTSPDRVRVTRPTLRWDWFDTDAQVHESIPKDAIVTYDLRILYGKGSGIIYEKYELNEPRHKLERKLPRRGTFTWSVRANFRWNGKLRRTPWSGAFQLTTRA